MSMPDERLRPEDHNIADFAGAAINAELQFLEDKRLTFEASALSGLTKWESDFVDDLYDRIRRQEANDERMLLTDRQRATLRRIIAKRGR